MNFPLATAPSAVLVRLQLPPAGRLRHKITGRLRRNTEGLKLTSFTLRTSCHSLFAMHPDPKMGLLAAGASSDSEVGGGTVDNYVGECSPDNMEVESPNLSISREIVDTTADVEDAEASESR